MEYVFLNGRIIEAAAARVPTTDRGLLLGDGLFETMRTYGGHVFQLGAHMARLRGSADFLRLRFPLADDAVSEAVDELVRLNECPDAYVRLTLTRGWETAGLNLAGTGAPTVILHVRRLTPYPAERYSHGARLIVSRVRQSSASPLPRHKTLNYLPYLLARQEARDAGADGAVLLNDAGQVTEEAVSNLFFVRGETLYTAPVYCGLLPGVTRAAVIEAARQAGMVVEERPVAAGEIHDFDEAFLTNSLMEVLPVRSVDKRGLACKAPGKVTLYVRELYRSLVKRETN